MIPVTKPFLPPIKEYEKYLEGIWERNWITNSGPLVTELEEKLKEFLGVKHFFFVSNGTIALQIAIKSLSLNAEVITTPFSYIATSSSLAWENCTPVFADIDDTYLGINPIEIEKKITDKTQAILATHVYGNSCKVNEIKLLAEKYNLKVIYDGAHAFGVKYNGDSVFNYGDVSTLSFHATKLFHTGEGGGLATNSDEIAEKIWYQRNFGHKGYEDYWGIGINGKNSELHAAMGLTVLPYVNDIISKRRSISQLYDTELQESFSKGLQKPGILPGLTYNYAYYPVLFKSEDNLKLVKEKLESEDIFIRRYFYPSLSSIKFFGNQKMEIADDISTRAGCLPLYHTLSEKEVTKIASVINKYTA